VQATGNPGTCETSLARFIETVGRNCLPFNG
jgi:hypothetical protein